MFGDLIDRYNTGSIKWDKAKDVFKAKDDILPMWVADMDFKTPLEVIEALETRAEHGIFGYTYLPDSYYSAIVNWQKKRNGWDIKKEWIKYCPGVLSALNIAIRAFTDESDFVVIQTPVYHPFYKIITRNKRKIVKNVLSENSLKYEINFEDLEVKFKNNNVKLFVLCNPHNPVGRVYTKDELIKIGRLCKKYNVLIFSDEIHSDIVYKKHYPISSINDEIADFAITCFSPSKTFNIPGLNTASAVIINEKMRKQFEDECERTGSSMPNVLSITAAEACYTKGEQWLEDLIDYLKSNMEYMEKAIKSISGIEFRKPEGTYLAWLDFRESGYDLDKINSMIVNNSKIGLNDGKIFGETGRGFQRLNFACPHQRLEKAIKQLDKWNK